MKLLKLAALTIFSASILSCGDDDSGAPAYELTVENAVGSYSLNELQGEDKAVVVLNANEQEVAETITVSEGSLFTGATVTLLADGTFTITGSYALETTVTIDGDIDEDAAGGGIVNLDDSGSYALDIDNEVITFTSMNQQLLEGDYDLELSEESMDITQLSLLVDSTEATTTTTTTTEFSYSFGR